MRSPRVLRIMQFLKKSAMPKRNPPFSAPVSPQALRELPEPTQGARSLQVFSLSLIIGLAFWGGMYLLRFSGNFDPFVYDETPHVAAFINRPTQQANIDGALLFTAHCLSCHTEQNPVFRLIYPPLRDSPFVHEHPYVPIAIVLKGVQGPFPFNGRSYNAVMAPFESLPDAHIAAILTFLRSPAWDNDAPPITAPTVRRVRTLLNDRNAHWTYPELMDWRNQFAN